MRFITECHSNYLAFKLHVSIKALQSSSFHLSIETSSEENIVIQVDLASTKCIGASVQVNRKRSLKCILQPAHYRHSGHGKGAVDGEGGTVNRPVYQRIMSGRTPFYSAEDLIALSTLFMLRFR